MDAEEVEALRSAIADLERAQTENLARVSTYEQSLATTQSRREIVEDSLRGLRLSLSELYTDEIVDIARVRETRELLSCNIQFEAELDADTAKQTKELGVVVEHHIPAATTALAELKKREAHTAEILEGPWTKRLLTDS